MTFYPFEKGELIYHNQLASKEDVADWKLEGSAKISTYKNNVLLENELDPEVYGDDAHWVLWCPEQFPDRMMIEWEFSPIEEQIGRASCRERVWIGEGGGGLKEKRKERSRDGDGISIV